MKSERYEQGLSGEKLAEDYLTGQGMTCIARRYRGGTGEVDLILQDGETLVFAEVKSRPDSLPGSGLMAVSAGKQRRLISAAEAFLQERDAFGRPVRFDVVEISRSGILWVPNAFMAQE